MTCCFGQSYVCSCHVQAGAWIPALVETLVILANHQLLPDSWNESILRYLTGTTTRNIVARSFSPLLLAGAVIACHGTAFRAAAYNALGRHFTYELSIKQDHTLITSFPYNIVRHPSYLGGLTTYVGVGMSLATPDGWVRVALLPWLRSTPVTAQKAAVAAIAGYSAATFTLVTCMFLTRVSVEDTMLRQQFGQQWDKWAQQVRYQIIPFVL
jgi:protein-S-isoprenylcysteine O-methyltransferase Ste14